MMDAVHYISSSILAESRNFVAESPEKLLTVLALPFGISLSLYIRYRNRGARNSSEL